MAIDEWNDLIRVKKVDIVILDMPLFDTTKYKDVNLLDLNPNTFYLRVNEHEF